MMRTTPGIQFKFAGGDASVSGYASVFNESDLSGDVVSPGAFSQTIKEIEASGHALPMLVGHDQNSVVGSWRELSEDAVGLFVSGRINSDVSRAREILSLVRNKDLSGLSIGFQTPPDGRVIKSGVPHLEKVRLLEISLVAVPAAPRARVSLKDFSSLGDYSDFLQSGGLPRREAEYVARKSWPAINAEQEDYTALIQALAQSITQLKRK
jgi:hypothetical protein